MTDMMIQEIQPPIWKFYPKVGEPQVVPPERWQWVAYYTDGTVLKQFADDHRYHQFDEIQQDKLEGFVMVCQGCQPFIIHWKPGRKLIHFYQTRRLEVNTPRDTTIKMVCFGYQQGEMKVINVIMPNDQIRQVEDMSQIVIQLI
jgi:hypothetical protein